MKINNDQFKISQATHDGEGNKLELEEKPVNRVIDTTVQVDGSRGGKLGGMKTQVTLSTTLGELAQSVRRFCKDCKHFNNAAWQRSLRGIEKSGDIAKKEEINAMRAALLSTQNAQLSTMHEDPDGDVDVEAALASMGCCEALTAQSDELVLVHPFASCPDTVITPQSPNGLFQPASRANERATAQVYDKLIRKGKAK